MNKIATKTRCLFSIFHLQSTIMEESKANVKGEMENIQIGVQDQDGGAIIYFKIKKTCPNDHQLDDGDTMEVYQEQLGGEETKIKVVSFNIS